MVDVYAFSAKPTFYRGSRFRSRLEARWAAFFDIRERQWEYEPFDLDGYVPDFILYGRARNFIIEIKPQSLMHVCADQISRGMNASHRCGYGFAVLNETIIQRSFVGGDVYCTCGAVCPAEGEEPSEIIVGRSLVDNGFDFLDGVSRGHLDGEISNIANVTAVQDDFRRASTKVQWAAA